MNRHSWVVAVAGAAVLAAGVGVYSGAFNVAADSPHWSAASHVFALMRDRSIAVRADGQTVPNLADRDPTATGAEHYSEMCTGCHLAPGITNSELRQGLYPPPLDFSAGTSLRPAEAFWVIKHGIKMSAMPAWGRTHERRLQRTTIMTRPTTTMTPYPGRTTRERTELRPSLARLQWARHRP